MDCTSDIVTGLQGPPGIAVDGNYIYWSDALANTIGRARLDGTDPSAPVVER